MNFISASLLFAIPTFVKLLAGLLVIKVIAINLGPNGLGQLGQFISLIAMLGVLAGGGITTGIVKYVAEFRDQQKKLEDYVQTASTITLLACVALTIILCYFGSEISQFLFKTPNYSFQIQVLGFVQIAIGISSFFLGILNGFRQMKAFAYVSLVSVLLGASGLILGCSRYGITGTMYGLMWFSSCQVIALVIWYSYAFKGSWRFIKPNWSPQIAKQFSHFTVMQLVTVFTMQMSQIIIRNTLETKEGWASVGQWQGLVKISDAYLLFITVVLANYYMPKLSALHEKKLVIKEVMATYKIVIPTLLIIAPLIYIFRSHIIIILYSKEFLVIEDLFFWQMIGDFLKVIAYISGYVAIAKAASKLYVAAEIFQSLALVSLSLFFIHQYGTHGAVYAYVITYIIYACVSLFCLFLYAKRR